MRHTAVYPREAAHLVVDSGGTIVEVARHIGVGELLLGYLGYWVAVERARNR